jgi:hypothetical protein
MHGLIFGELKKYVEARFGTEVWNEMLKEAGLEWRFYNHVQEYPDEEIVRIVSAACRATKRSSATILEDFGEFIAPDLLSMFRPMIRPEWRTLDLICNSEAVIHQVARIQNPGATPPILSCHRQNGYEIVIFYASPRRMCALAKGIIRGIARHYGEAVSITETDCLLRGNAHCRISARIEAAEHRANTGRLSYE